MRACCVDGCIVPSEDTVFFEFPTSRTLRQRWLDVVRLSGKLTSDSMICSQHFLTTDYELIRGKTRLKRKVVPSQLLTITKKVSEQPPSSINCSDKPEKRQSSYKPNRRRKYNKSDKSQTPEEADTRQSPNISDGRQSTNGLDRPPSPVEDTDKSDMCQTPDESDHRTILTGQSDILENRQILSDSESIDASDRLNDKMYPTLVPEDIEEALNKLEEEKRKKKSESLSKLSKGLSKISERLCRISDSLQRDDVRRCDLTNGGCDFLTNERVSSGVSLKNSQLMPDPKQTDIEEMITNYQIKNKIPNNALAVDLEETKREEDRRREGSKDKVEIGEVPDLDNDVPPVFIEISVGNDVKSQTAAPGTEDCLMLLESVQCEVDPATLMLPEPEEEVTITSDDEPPEKENRKEDPISLLTSSDDDEVIIQEPHIDTVEVSDETDEDDMPLVKLVKAPKKRAKRSSKQKDFFARVMWGGAEFFCMQCQFTCTSRREFRLHRETHSTVLQVCGICSYTTASKAQYKRHVRTHKGEKRYKCHLCEYKARHNMSLIYHLKTHSKSAVEMSKGKGYKCKKCDFRSDVKTVALRHVKVCGESIRFMCGECDYQTARRSDMSRHKRRKHKDEVEDDEYCP